MPAAIAATVSPAEKVFCGENCKALFIRV